MFCRDAHWSYSVERRKRKGRTVVYAFKLHQKLVHYCKELVRREIRYRCQRTCQSEKIATPQNSGEDNLLCICDGQTTSRNNVMIVIDKRRTWSRSAAELRRSRRRLPPYWFMTCEIIRASSSSCKFINYLWYAGYGTLHFRLSANWSKWCARHQSLIDG